MINIEDLIAVVIYAVLQENQSVLASKQLRLQKSVTLEDLNRAMNALCRTHAMHSGEEEER
jgi:hypothetical protein